jgi:NADPH-ferrihemoprotein reductase
LGKIVVNRELHSKDSDRSCRHIEIEVGSAIRYETGDHVGLYAENDISLVNQVAQKFDVDLDSIFSMLPIENKDK